MNHIEYEQWVSYVKNELDDHTRAVYEDHMFICEECLDRYMKTVESFYDELPKLQDDFTDKVVDHVKKQSTGKTEKTQSKIKKSFFHYTIAAVMTLILMSSGLFGQLIQVTSNFEAKASEQNQSLTEQLLDRTINIIQVIERNKEVE